jgi:hypothetical protein
MNIHGWMLTPTINKGFTTTEVTVCANVVSIGQPVINAVPVIG